MTIFQASVKSQIKLVGLPESGMGFQIVHYENEYWVALQSTVVLPLAQLRSAPEAADKLAELFLDAEEERIANLDPINLSGDVSLAFSQLDKSVDNSNVGLNRPDQVSRPPAGLARSKRPLNYYRFSATPKDPRVDKYGNFTPGTYATTYADFHFVPSGFAAVGRYALPNPAAARFLFQITTYDRPTFMGTATPNFGQAGGGVEVYFDAGAKNDSGASFMIDAG